MAFSQQIILSPGEFDEVTQSFPLYYDSPADLYGFQFTVTSGVDTIYGGILEEYDLTLSWNIQNNGSVLVVVFSSWGAPVPPGEGLFFNVGLNPNYMGQICFNFDDPFLLDDPCIQIGLCDHPGDMNSDLEINIMDIVLIVDCILENDYCPCGNIYQDEGVDITDIVVVVNFILNDGTHTVVKIGYGWGFPACFTWTNDSSWCYCEKYFQAMGDDFIYTLYSHCSDPEVSITGTLEQDDWPAMLNQIDREYLLSLDDTYGSMGGDDTFFNWVLIVWDDTTKYIGYTDNIEYWEELTDLVPLVETIVPISNNYSDLLVCATPPDPGPCDGNCTGYFFNGDTGQCEAFDYGCCYGIVPFQTLDSCENRCE